MADELSHLVGPVVRGFDPDIVDALTIAIEKDNPGASGDGLTSQLLRESGVDSARSRAWVSALTEYAVGQRAENKDVLDEWQRKWQPAADRAAGGLKEVLA